MREGGGCVSQEPGVNFCEGRRREPLERSWVMLPRKFANRKILKRHFQHSRADSCVEKVPKIARYFRFNFDKKALTSAMIYFQN